MKPTNPLLDRHESHEPLQYAAVEAAHIRNAVDVAIRRAEDDKQTILNAAPNDKRQRLLMFDALYDRMDGILSPIYFIAEVHTDEEVRQTAHEAVERLFQFLNGLRLDEDLYLALKGFSETNPSDLTAAERRFMTQMLDDYHRNGFQLPPDKRAELKQLDDLLSKCTIQFSKNVSEAEGVLYVEEADMQGFSEDFKETYRDEDGRYRISTRYPSYKPFMQYQRDEALRKRLFELYLTRAVDTNKPLLDEILRLRHEKARLLGFDTFAAYALEDKMAKQPERVWAFLDDLSEKLREKAERDYREMCEIAGADRVEPWNKAFYANKLREERYRLDEEETRPYFALENVLKGLFHITGVLFGIRYEVVEDRPVWHDSVRCYDMREGNRLVGRFYLDLHPRPKKYSHAACFGLRMGRADGDDYRPPEAALVCNFTEPTKTKPSLLNHDEVETLFHEFGHLLHQLLTTSPLSCMAGTSVARDFVEAPSQILENWCWERDMLKSFAHHHETGEPIPDELVDKMLAVKHLNSGIDNEIQVFYSTIDMTYHDGLVPESEEDTTRELARLQEERTRFRYLEGTCMQASFDHLTGYAAGYYGYLWSKVYAQDMFSVFQEKGLLDEGAGRRFRDRILAPGDTEPPMELVTSFLGRDPRSDAFLRSLGV